MMKTSKEVYNERVSLLLHRLAVENETPWWAFWRPRFPYASEPLRHDAANIIRDHHGGAILDIGTRLVGDE